ncbi:hypothetical protein OIE66_35140 [Nonomuraea sp. NBC_01738]|uniref:AMIN-like domain-containing (lipo)protein n=1 Tax=Nonomuraea sp. NBC_01738 TaxID=2976003 RepID=UPI002E0DF10F|nr:hypothetical protein OIE66_35140 [Nonomuraea sp. NBC_01738]
MGPTRTAAVILCLAVLTACGTAGRDGTTAAVTPATNATGETGAGTPPTGEPAPTALPAPTGTAEVEAAHEGGDPALVTGVRFAAHGSYDRVVIDLKGEMPGYTVVWADELVEDGSGNTIDAPGGAYLQVTLNPANAHTDKGEPTWAGGPVFQAGLGNVTSVVRTGDFEGRVGVGIVLDHRAGFRVIQQSAPNRLVIDVAD